MAFLGVTVYPSTARRAASFSSRWFTSSPRLCERVRMRLCVQVCMCFWRQVEAILLCLNMHVLGRMRACCVPLCQLPVHVTCCFDGQTQGSERGRKDFANLPFAPPLALL
jgi:hypothetical protein